MWQKQSLLVIFFAALQAQALSKLNLLSLFIKIKIQDTRSTAGSQNKLLTITQFHRLIFHSMHDDSIVINRLFNPRGFPSMNSLF